MAVEARTGERWRQRTVKMKIHRRRAGFGTALMVVGGLLILSATSLFLYNDIRDTKVSEVAASIADEFDARVKADSDGREAAGERSEIYIDGEIYIGVLKIPSLQLLLPVTRDWSYARLKISPCRYSGSAAADDMVIAAHNYRSQFGRIHKLPIGNALTYTDAYGNTIDYTVEKIEQLEATDIEGMTASGYDFTLFTCTYGGVARIAVRCNRTS
jgi:sortase A